MSWIDIGNFSTDMHRFTMGGLSILLDVNSGAIHLLDRVANDLITELINAGGNLPAAANQCARRHGLEAASRAAEEVWQLWQEGSFCSPPTPPPPDPDRQSGGWLKSLCLHVAHDCNLRCRYCFAGSGPFGGDRTLMTPETGRQAIDFLLSRVGPRPTCEVDFFGGEPLMNLPVVRDLVTYGRQSAKAVGKEIRFTLTTNGVLLDDAVADFLNREGIRVVLSLDGRPEVHNAMRPTAGGGESYHRVTVRLRDFVRSRHGRDYYIRGTFTGLHPDFSRDVAHLLELGFDQLSVEPVVAGPAEDYALREEQLPILCDQYERLAGMMVEAEEAGRPFNFFHFNLNLFRGPCLPRRLAGCGAGVEYLAVTPEGELYPCHQFVGQREWRLGSLPAGITRPDLVDRFAAAHIFNKPACRSCWARFFCSGGCHANNQAHGGGLLTPYALGCILQKKRLECAIYLEVRRAVAGGGEGKSR